MNLILFSPAEIDRPLPRADRRAVHILDVLRRQVGESFDAGLVNGARGRATLTAVDPTALTLSFTWTTPPAAPAPITVLIGMPRPQTARDILRDATTLGVASLQFVTTNQTEAGYARSTLWSTDEWRRHALAGAEQAFDTRIPEVQHGQTLRTSLAALPARGTRLALDNYEAAEPLSAATIAPPATLAIGGERGWSAADRGQLRAHQFTFVHLGPRVLRTESASLVAIALVRQKLGLL